MAVCYALGFDHADKMIKETPNEVLSIGCGRGFLEQTLTGMGIKVTATDIADNRSDSCKGFDFVLGGMDKIPQKEYDCVIFCESIEHIPEEEFAAAWPLIMETLRRTRGRLIVVNWEDYHPILPDGSGWDHVRFVGDSFYDWLASFGKPVVRKGSHLVIKFQPI